MVTGLKSRLIGIPQRRGQSGRPTGLCCRGKYQIFTDLSLPLTTMTPVSANGTKAARTLTHNTTVYVHPVFGADR